MTGNIREDLMSPEFGIHEGLDARAWIRHEQREILRRSTAFQLAPGGICIVPNRRGNGGETTFSMKTHDGVFVYQDTWVIGPDGRLRGNGRHFEIVTKLQLVAGGPTRRAMAIRDHGGSLVSVVPIGLALAECELNSGMSSSEDSFQTLSLLIEGDDCLGRQAKFRMSSDSGVRSTESVWLRGKEEPEFEDDLFPAIRGREVQVPGSRARLWSLNVMLADGDRTMVEHPRSGEYVFGKDVAMAVLTDAMDNDWMTVSDGERG